MDRAFADPADITPSQPAPCYGILFAEDFDDPVVAQPASPVAEPAPPPPVITAADVDAACAAAVSAARREWRAGWEQDRLDALTALGARIADSQDAAERLALAATEATATAILSMVGGLLPHFGRQHGAAEVRALVSRLLPTLRTSARCAIRVHADLAAGIERDLAEADLPGTVSVLPASIDRGDVRVTWENGSACRDTRQILQAVTDALSQLGLHGPAQPDPIEIPAKRSLAYAD